jgi:hypothetical protein
MHGRFSLLCFNHRRGGTAHHSNDGDITMGYKLEREAARAVAQSAIACGLVPYIAERGTYGYITDATGSRVLSFGCDLGSVNYSGNYRSQSVGSGWSIGRYAGTDAITVRRAWDQVAEKPAECIMFGERVRMRTEREYLAIYQESSKFAPYDPAK